MKILVTGGCGFIGTNFVNYMLKKYPTYSIVNIDKITYAGNDNNLFEWMMNPRYKWLKFDINSPRIKKYVEDCDIIVHFAAETHVDRSIISADEFIHTNVSGTLNLLKMALQFNKRFHHISTDEVFGSLSLDSAEIFNEKTHYAPRNPYAASKAASDHLVRSFYETYKLDTTISNCSNNYGPYQNKEKFLPKTILNILKGIKVPVYGDGLNVRDWVYVEDHCRAIDMIIHHGRIGGTYCVSGMKEDWNNLKIISVVAELMGKKLDDVIKFVPDRLGHDRKYAVDWSKIHRELGWEPQFEIKENLLKVE